MLTTQVEAQNSNLQTTEGWKLADYTVRNESNLFILTERKRMLSFLITCILACDPVGL